MSKPSYREALLKAGLKVMFRAGYQAASVRDICAAAGVPQGCFTNHFRSKEAFAKLGVDAAGGPPSVLSTTVDNEIKKWVKVANEKNVKIEP